MLLNLKVFRIVALFVLTFNYLNSNAQGLLFNSNDSLVTKRTSLHVFTHDVPVFQDHLEINFDLSLWDNEHLGYVCSLADKDNSYSLSYLYMDGAAYLNFNIDRQSNKIKIPLNSFLLKKGSWIRIKVLMDFKADKVSIYINNALYQAEKFGFKNSIYGNLIFGKNQFYTEVPNMSIKNLTVSDGEKRYSFPLDEWRGNLVHDKDGDITGMVENPVWLINGSYFWKLAYRQSFKDVAGLNFNTLNQSLFIFKRDSLITFDPELKATTASAYNTPMPVPMVLGKSIFNAKENKCYVYELFDIPKGKPSMAALNMEKNNLQWETIGKTILPQQLHHHNVFYDLKQDTFYIFGGYGGYKYYNTFLKYNKTADHWEKAVFSGDKITPRFFAATGNADSKDDLFLFGGYGNESGNQVVGGKQFYDLYRISLNNHTVKKCWAIHPEKDVFVPANNLILSADKKYFYALCYPHEAAKTELRLYRFAIKDGSYEVVSAPIPVTSERIESDINLFFNPKTQLFYCTVQEFTDRKQSVIKVYLLLSPPVSRASYLRSLNPQKQSHNTLIYIAVLAVVAIVIGGLVILYKRKPGNQLTESEVRNDLPVESIDIKKNAVYLLGEFLVIDKNGKDITYMFSPKIKQLFLLILLNSRYANGITSKKISLALWPDKDVAKTKNIKGVTFNHLRNIIGDINGIELSFISDTYVFSTGDEFFCDYWQLSDLINNSGVNGQPVLDHLNVILRGALLSDMTDAWLDDFKYAYEERLLQIIIPELKKQYELRELKLVLEICKLIFSTDPFNDEALKYQLKSLRRLKGIEYSRKAYDLFTLEYKRSLGIDYPIAFDKIIY